MKLRPAARVAVLLSAVMATPLAASQDSSNLLGFVEDSHGAPLAGAVISLFGRGLGGGGLVTLTDTAGRFFLPALPAGAYTLRALRDGHAPAPARRITVVPGRDSVFTVSLTPLAERARAAAEAAAAAVPPEEVVRELRWLTRHKRRSVLEARSGDDSEAEDEPRLTHPVASRALDLGGTFEVLTTPAAMGIDPAALGLEDRSTSLSVLRLDGPLASSGRWSLGGLLSESEGTTWRMAAEFVIAPGGGHEIQAGSGYGSSFLKPVAGSGGGQNRSVGAVFAHDRWQVSEMVAATVGGRFSYIAYLQKAHHFDPLVSVEFRADDHTRVTGSASRRTLTPGGDLLALSSIASAPALAMAVMDAALEAEKIVRYEVAVDQTFGQSTVRAYTYHEVVDDPLTNIFSEAGHALRIANSAPMAARGLGLTVARRFGDHVQGSLTYSRGHGWQRATASDVRAPIDDADFHDLVARVEGAIVASGTRVAAFYRFNRLQPVEDPAAVNSTRFDVQLSQGLPFLGSLTRAEWNLLLAIRNLYYEADEGAMLDEVTVADPPKRVLGGISVRF